MGTVDRGLSACQVPTTHHQVSSQCRGTISSQQLLLSFSSSHQRLLQRGREGSSAILLVFSATRPAPPQMSPEMDKRLVSATTKWSVWPWEAAWLDTASSNGTKPSVRGFVVS